VCHVRSSLWCVPFSVPLFIHFLTMYYLSQAPFAHPVSFVFVIGSGFVSCNKLSHDVRQNIVVTSPGHACPLIYNCVGGVGVRRVVFERQEGQGYGTKNRQTKPSA